MSALPAVDRANAALAHLLLSATSVDMDVRVAADDAAREHAALTKELFEALEEIAAPVVCPPRTLDEAFSQREALRDIARAAITKASAEQVPA